jgi:hypothetical protein
MQHFQYHALGPFLIALLIVACRPGALSESSEDPNQRAYQQFPNKEDLVKQEKVLEASAVQTLQSIIKQLEKEHAPTKSFFEEISKKLKQDIEQAKKDPKVAKKLVKETQTVQADLQELIGKLEAYGSVIVVENLHPTLRGMFNAVVMIPEVSNANTANGGAGRPINRDNLVNEHKKWYKGVIKKHFRSTTKYNTHVRTFITVVLLENAKRLQPAINANLALFQNLLTQH